MDDRTLGSELQRARTAMRLRQEDVAAAFNASRRRVSDYERDILQPPLEQLRDLARVLGLSHRLLERLWVPPEPLGEVAELFRLRKPRYQPKGDQPIWRRMRALYRKDKALYNTLWGMLGQREDWPSVRRFYVDVQADCGNEVLGLYKQMLGPNMGPARLAPLAMGFRTLPVIHYKTGEVVGDCRVPAMLRKGPEPAVIFPQTTVQTAWGPARPDALVGVRTKGGMLYCAAEYDGEKHDPTKDAFRPEQLRMAVVRFTAAEIWAHGFVTLFWNRVYRALGLAG